MEQAKDERVFQTANKTSNQTINKTPNKLPIKQHIKQPIKLSSQQPIKQPIRQANNKSNNQYNNHHVCTCVYQCECKLQHLQTMIINMIMNCVRIRSAKLHISMTNVWDDSRGSCVLAEEIGWSRAVTQWCMLAHIQPYCHALSTCQVHQCIDHALSIHFHAQCVTGQSKADWTTEAQRMHHKCTHTCTYHGCVLCTGMAAPSKCAEGSGPQAFPTSGVTARHPGNTLPYVVHRPGMTVINYLLGGLFAVFHHCERLFSCWLVGVLCGCLLVCLFDCLHFIVWLLVS